mmetsp:Transcript_26364/g.41234  ORF Transcript_26364/g.41234 Transcript_26364/m.41234 type:complete len:161 (+) Transcript_26364:190-672(+)
MQHIHLCSRIHVSSALGGSGSVKLKLEKSKCTGLVSHFLTFLAIISLPHRFPAQIPGTSASWPPCFSNSSGTLTPCLSGTTCSGSSVLNHFSLAVKYTSKSQIPNPEPNLASQTQDLIAHHQTHNPKPSRPSPKARALNRPVPQSQWLRFEASHADRNRL